MYDREHMLLQWYGVFTGTPGSGTVWDEFAGTLRFAGSQIALAETNDVADGIAEALGAWWFNGDNFIPNSAWLYGVKWNRIGTDGRYADSGNTRFGYLDAPVQGATTAIHPLQTAWATTWTTDRSRGRASKGRTFWPTAVPVSNQDQLRASAANCTKLANASATLIQSLNVAVNAGGSALNAMVMSDLGQGTSGIITGIRVGNRLDTQRRRANRTPEEYTSRSTAP